MPSHLFQSFVCTAWAIWRGRNDVVMGGKVKDLAACARYYHEALLACQVTAIASAAGRPSPGMTQHQETSSQNQRDCECYVDGSWSENGAAGIGIILVQRGRIIYWASRRVTAISPSQVEAIAVLHGYKLMQDSGCREGVIFSDSLEVVDSIAHGQPVIHDWRSYHEVWNAWLLKGQLEGKIITRHCGREEEMLKIAHDLANEARRELTDRTVTELEEIGNEN